MLLHAGLGSVALVLQTLFPAIGNWWYSMTLLAPGAYIYYMSRGTRPEQVQVLTQPSCKLFAAGRPAAAGAFKPGEPVGRTFELGYLNLTTGFAPVQIKVKMVTADDEQTTDIIVEGDKEEIERFWKVGMRVETHTHAHAQTVCFGWKRPGFAAGQDGMGDVSTFCATAQTGWFQPEPV